MKVSSQTATLVADSRCLLGEGPMWDNRLQKLFWVDIDGRAFIVLHPITGKVTKTEVGVMIGAIAPTRSGNLLMALETGMALYDFGNSKIISLKVLENSNEKMRYNDGKVGTNGHFWIGSMHKDFLEHSGSLYKMNPNGEVAIMVRNTTISNGMAWSDCNTVFYFIDSPTQCVFSFTWDAHGERLSNRKEVIRIPKEMGTPDGMCMDAEGMLWIAHWGGGCVSRWNPNQGALMEIVHVPAQQVTSCCFGGKNLEVLYITTARGGLSEQELQRYPQSGGLFAHVPGVTGKKSHYFDDSKFKKPEKWNTPD